jgi:hypothetical protein
MNMQPCFDCGNPIDIDAYPCYYALDVDKEICKECYEKRYGKVVEPHYI